MADTNIDSIDFPTSAVRVKKMLTTHSNWLTANCEYPWIQMHSTYSFTEHAPVDHKTITGAPFPSSRFNHASGSMIFFTNDQDRTKFLLTFVGD